MRNNDISAASSGLGLEPNARSSSTNPRVFARYGDPAGVADNANWPWSVRSDNATLSISSIRVMANRNGASEITTEP